MMDWKPTSSQQALKGEMPLSKVGQTSGISSSQLGRTPRCTVEKIKGADIPSLNGLFTRVVEIDVEDGTPYLYIFGGTRDVSATQSIITNDFYRLNMRTLEWTDLNKSQPVFRECLEGNNPFLRRLLNHSLPSRENSASALYVHNERIFFNIFGGTDPLTMNPTNDLFVVDMSRVVWERLVTLNADGSEATDLIPRSGAGAIVLQDKLFIFGGWRRPRSESTAYGVNVNAFSVLDLHSRIWVVKDRPYPQQVGSLGYNISLFAPQVYQDQKILIIRNKVDDDRPIEFKGNFMWLFDTETYTFSRQEYAGDVPPPHAWADVSAHRGSDKTCVLYGSIDDPVNNELPSDLWTFDVVSGLWKCEGFREELWNLDLDLQTLEHVPGKGWCLLGYKQSKQPGRRPRRKKGAPQEDYKRRWNVCVTLQLENA